MIWSCERDMTQQRMMSDQVADIITTWVTDEELLSDEEDAVPQLVCSTSPAANLAIISRESGDENEAHDESTSSTQNVTTVKIASRNGTI